MVAPKSQQNRATAFDTHSQLFILQVNTGLTSMLRVMDLVTVFHSKSVGSLSDS